MRENVPIKIGICPRPPFFHLCPLEFAYERGIYDTKPLPVSGRGVNDTILRPCFSHNRRIEKKSIILLSRAVPLILIVVAPPPKPKKLRKEVTKVQCHSSQQTAQFLGTYFPFPFFQGTSKETVFLKTFLESLSTGIEFV